MSEPVPAHAGRAVAASDESAAQFLKELVEIPSVSGEEGRAVSRFAEHAEALGFEATVDEAGNAVCSRAGAGRSGPEIVLLGHIDTVAGEIPVRIEDGVLHGRGAVDAKGPLVTLLYAAARAEVPSDVALRVIAAVGEEAPDSPGARHVAERMRPRACVIGEPSGWDGVTLGYKGRLLVRATAERAGAHSAGPESSASDVIFAWWSSVLELVESLEQKGAGDESTRVFDRVQASVHSIDSAHDGLRDRCRCHAGFRLPLGVSPWELERAVREITPDSIRAHFAGHTPAHATGRDDAVVGALSAAIREAGGRPRHKRKTGTADLNVVGPVWGCPIAAYGPGDSALDHTPEERIELAELGRAIGVLTGALERLAGDLARSE